MTVSCNIGAETIHHDLHVTLHADQTGIAVIDFIQLPKKAESAVFSLRNSLMVVAHDAELETLGTRTDDRMRQYRINRLPADGKVQLLYQGNILSAGMEGVFNIAMGFPGVEDPDTVSAIAGKLPHYSSYGRLVFTQSDARNILKEHLPVLVSPIARPLSE